MHQPPQDRRKIVSLPLLFRTATSFLRNSEIRSVESKGGITQISNIYVRRRYRIRNKYLLLSYNAAVSETSDGAPLKRGILTTIVVDIPRFEWAPSPVANVSSDVHKGKNRWSFL